MDEGSGSVSGGDTTLESALAVLRQHYGGQLEGSRDRTEAQIRYTLKEQLGLDEATSFQLFRQLCDTGHLSYVEGQGRAADRDEPNTTGPVISLPGTLSGGGGGQLITTASPAMIMGNVDYEGGDVNSGLADAARPEAPVEYEDENGGDAEDDDAQLADASSAGYWRIG